MTRGRWELLMELKNGAYIRFTRSTRGSDRAQLIKSGAFVAAVRRVPMPSFNILVRKRWIQVRPYSVKAEDDGTMVSLYVISFTGLELLDATKEPPRTKASGAVEYRCTECGNRRTYHARGRPVQNCRVCGGRDCMERL